MSVISLALSNAFIENYEVLQSRQTLIIPFIRRSNNGDMQLKTADTGTIYKAK